MDEMATANLVFFFTFTPFSCTYYSLAFGSARYAPFSCSPVSKLPNKLAPNVPKSILKNPPLCSLVSFSIVLLTPFNKIPEFSRASIIFIISFKSSSSITSLIPEPCIFFEYFHQLQT